MPQELPIRRMIDREDRRRMRQNMAAGAVALVLLAGSYWVVTELTSSSRRLACFEAGHRNCAPIDAPRYLEPRYK